jgi:murein DD-endopeptidase MepM/ murein hydrolase activator NlpD
MGHQGQDIRPSSCAKDVHVAVSAFEGTITNIGSYSVYVLSPDGKTRADYLHMSNVIVKVGAKVGRGTPLGRVSNVFQMEAPTTIHLHFNIRQNLPGLGWTFVPPYFALIDSYQRLLAGKP